VILEKKLWGIRLNRFRIISTKTFVVTAWFCRWFYEAVYSGEIDAVITYFIDEITE
jgi:hypothetical protein